MTLNIQLDDTKVARLIAVIEAAKDFTSSKRIYDDAKLFHKLLTELLSNPCTSIQIIDDPEE